MNQNDNFRELFGIHMIKGGILHPFYFENNDFLPLLIINNCNGFCYLIGRNVINII